MLNTAGNNSRYVFDVMQIVEEDASAAHVLTSQEQSEAHKNAMDCALKEVASACDRASELKVGSELVKAICLCVSLWFLQL